MKNHVTIQTHTSARDLRLAKQHLPLHIHSAAGILRRKAEGMAYLQRLGVPLRRVAMQSRVFAASYHEKVGSYRTYVAMVSIL